MHNILQFILMNNLIILGIFLSQGFQMQILLDKQKQRTY